MGRRCRERDMRIVDYHRLRVMQFRRNADSATFAETRAMYLRLADSEEALAQQAERIEADERKAPQGNGGGA